MQKITLPLLMIASLTTLVSCGTQTNNTASPLTSSVPPVTGVVETQAPVASGTTSPTVNPVKSEVFTRTETVSYKTPAGSDPVEFSVTVTDGVITAASATVKAENEISKKYQTAFVSEVSSKVVGKKAKDLKLDAIGGASLTSGAFEMFARSF
jgi:uncharacterized protein with FMN-binding domain